MTSPHPDATRARRNGAADRPRMERMRRVRAAAGEVPAVVWSRDGSRATPLPTPFPVATGRPWRSTTNAPPSSSTSERSPASTTWCVEERGGGGGRSHEYARIAPGPGWLGSGALRPPGDAGRVGGASLARCTSAARPAGTRRQSRPKARAGKPASGSLRPPPGCGGGSRSRVSGSVRLQPPPTGAGKRMAAPVSSCSHLD